MSPPKSQHHAARSPDFRGLGTLSLTRCHSAGPDTGAWALGPQSRREREKGGGTEVPLPPPSPGLKKPSAVGRPWQAGAESWRPWWWRRAGRALRSRPATLACALRSGREPLSLAGRRRTPRSGQEPGEKVRRQGHLGRTRLGELSGAATSCLPRTEDSRVGRPARSAGETATTPSTRDVYKRQGRRSPLEAGQSARPSPNGHALFPTPIAQPHARPAQPPPPPRPPRPAPTARPATPRPPRAVPAGHPADAAAPHGAGAPLATCLGASRPSPSTSSRTRSYRRRTGLQNTVRDGDLRVARSSRAPTQVGKRGRWEQLRASWWGRKFPRFPRAPVLAMSPVPWPVWPKPGPVLHRSARARKRVAGQVNLAPLLRLGELRADGAAAGPAPGWTGIGWARGGGRLSERGRAVGGGGDIRAATSELLAGAAAGDASGAHLPLDAGPGSCRLASFVRRRASWCPAGARLEPTRGPKATSVIPVWVACPRYRQQTASGDPQAANPAVSQSVDKSNHPFRKQVGSVPGDGAEDAESGSESRSGSEETSVCEKCCAEFFKWADFLQHKKTCTKNPLVLIVHDDEPAPPSEDFPEPSPASLPSDRTESEVAEEVAPTESSEVKAAVKEAEPMDVEASADKGPPGPGVPPPPPALPPQPEPAAFSMPSTNVTLETLLSTKAVYYTHLDVYKRQGSAR
ncbi:hypothetical protein NN561_010278 [Cricetulus griseus]